MAMRRSPFFPRPDLFRLSPRDASYRFTTFQCRRLKSRTIRGARIRFTFETGGSTRFAAKFKDGHFIPIVEGSDAHLRRQPCDCLLYGNRFTSFSLRIGGQFGREVLSVQFSRSEAGPDHPRVLTCHIFSEDGKENRAITSIEPDRDEDQSWILDLNCPHALASIKNCRLDDNGKTVCYIRKVAKNVLEIEARGLLREKHCFALAIASFLCPL
jgi:hypothetical protein